MEGLSDAFIIPLPLFKTLFPRVKDMKAQCEVYNFFQSDNTTYHYHKEVVFNFDDESGNPLELSSFGITGYPNATATIGIRGMENLNICFTPDMEKLIREKVVEFGRKKAKVAAEFKTLPPKKKVKK